MPDAAQAAQDVCRRGLEQLAGTTDVAIVFASFQHQAQFERLAAILHAELGTDCLLGCTGESIVCNDRELEGVPSLALWLAQLPDTNLVPLELDFQATGEGGHFTGWPEQLAGAWPEGASLILLGEPFSFPADVLLSRLNDDRPGTCVVGAMASGGGTTGENRLLLGGKSLHRGAVGLWMHGATRLRTVVSQGCRPVGWPLVVTKVEQNVILELGGKPALAQLQEIFGTLSAHEQSLFRHGLHLGQVINEYQDHFARGDFLVRNVQGADPKSGAIAIGDYLRVGQTVQFHVRDAATADEDLEAMLTAAQSNGNPQSLGALMFTCNGRGTCLFDAPHHDAQALAKHFPGMPVAGLFAQGEIGPVGGKSFLHGFTASIALFESR